MFRFEGGRRQVAEARTRPEAECAKISPTPTSSPDKHLPSSSYRRETQENPHADATHRFDVLAVRKAPPVDLRIPALRLSTFRDPVIPGFHRTVYGQEVASTGAADLLVQRSVARYAGGYGHCTFTPTELTQAFFDLVTWAELGVKPTP
jgi:hypothetical protein